MVQLRSKAKQCDSRFCMFSQYVKQPLNMTESFSTDKTECSLQSTLAFKAVIWEVHTPFLVMLPWL